MKQRRRGEFRTRSLLHTAVLCKYAGTISRHMYTTHFIDRFKALKLPSHATASAMIFLGNHYNTRHCNSSKVHKKRRTQRSTALLFILAKITWLDVLSLRKASQNRTVPHRCKITGSISPPSCLPFQNNLPSSPNTMRAVDKVIQHTQKAKESNVHYKTAHGVLEKYK